MSSIFFTFLGLVAIVATVAAMVLLYSKVLPQKLDGTFNNKYLQMLHDYFNFKKLYIESVLKFIFTLATVGCVVLALSGLLYTVFNLFTGFISFFDYGSFRYLTYLLEDTVFSALCCILLAVAGPIVLRLFYEGTMMLILMARNVVEINNKLSGPKE